MSIEAMKQALRTLEESVFPKQSVKHYRKYDDAVNALIAAIEQAGKQEPVGEVVQAFGDLTAVSIPEMPPVGTKLYTQPAPPEAWTSKELELMNEMIEQIKDLERQACEIINREWVGLTDEEITELFCDYEESQLPKFARAIEAKLKEKNGG